jgi:diadenosine tetraphosphatase ApaH/serine/threonine PP2A family protein phosphatase
MLLGVSAKTVVCGHTHMQFDRQVSGVRLVNAGSVGMPYESAPGAYWAMVGERIELRRSLYDRDAAATAIGETDWPMAKEFALENVLTVPSPQEAIAIFEPG